MLHEINWQKLAVAACYHAGDMAKRLGENRQQLRRQFLRVFGKCPRDWLEQQRFEWSKSQLAEGRRVKEVATDLGFKHPSNFSRWFHACQTKGLGAAQPRPDAS